MKKAMLVLAATLFAANVFAQSATTPATQPAKSTGTAASTPSKVHSTGTANQATMNPEKTRLKKDETALKQLNKQYKEAVEKKDKTKQEQLTSQIKNQKAEIEKDKKALHSKTTSSVKPAVNSNTVAATKTAQQPVNHK